MTPKPRTVTAQRRVVTTCRQRCYHRIGQRRHLDTELRAQPLYNQTPSIHGYPEQYLSNTHHNRTSFIPMTCRNPSAHLGDASTKAPVAPFPI
jgi:hypothetical protein